MPPRLRLPPTEPSLTEDRSGLSSLDRVREEATPSQLVLLESLTLSSVETSPSTLKSRQSRISSKMSEQSLTLDSLWARMVDAEVSATFSSLPQPRLQRPLRRPDNTLMEEILDLIYQQREKVAEEEAVVVASEEEVETVVDLEAVVVASVVAVVAALAVVAEVASVAIEVVASVAEEVVASVEAVVAEEVETVVAVEVCPSTQQQEDLSKQMPHPLREFCSTEW